MAEKPKEKKEGKKKVEKPKYQLYEVSGESLTRKNRSCPRCGPAVFMAQHAERLSCGNCGYTEFTKEVAAPKAEETEAKPEEAKPEEAPVEEKKEEIKEEKPEETKA